MTPETFLSRHGAQWLVLRRDPMWTDLLETIRAFDPSRAMPAVSATDATNNAEHLLGRISGFNLAVNVLTSLEPSPQHVAIEATYEPDEPIATDA